MSKEIARSSLAKTAATTIPASRTPRAKADGQEESIPVTLEQRQIMICEAAYYIAEHRGFEPGHDVEDWLAAELQIDAALTRPAPRGAGARAQR